MAHVPETRPAYHFTSPTGADCVPFDPNGAIFWNGRYHLGYIVGNYAECQRHFWWGHVSSSDLIDWKRHPPMLGPYPGDPDQGIFSGNAFVDKKGRVAIHYYGVNAGNCIAVSNGDDELDSFTKLSANPVMTDPGWDPFGWLEGDTYYSISGSDPVVRGSVPSLYKCTDDDQLEWTLVGDFFSRDMQDIDPDEDLSCPDMFRLGDRLVLLCISHTRGARYYFGRFEDEQFHPEEHFRMNWPGGACFAAETLLDDRNRRILWAWASGSPARTHGSPSSMTLPRVLSIGEDGSMRIEPVEEIDSLRRNHRRLEPGTVHPGADLELNEVHGDCMELRVAIDPGEAERCGVIVRRSPGGEEQTTIAYDAQQKLLRIGLDKSSLDRRMMPKAFIHDEEIGIKEADNPVVGAQEAPFDLPLGSTLDLRIYLDRSMLEVYANGRQCMTQRIYPTREDSLGVCLFSQKETATFSSVDAWDMAPIVVR